MFEELIKMKSEVEREIIFAQAKMQVICELIEKAKEKEAPSDEEYHLHEIVEE